MKKIISNQHFNLDHITAVLNERQDGNVYEGQLTVYSFNNSLIDILTECEEVADLMDYYGYTIEKDWNRGDVIIIRIVYYSVARPQAIQGLI
jgi:hypothetical protein